MAVAILEALEIIDREITLLDSEIIPIEIAVGRVVTEDYIASFNLPRFNNSAMDGYAVRVADSSKTVLCSEIIYAGDNPLMTLNDGNAIKIMTGAPLPKGCQAVVPIENVIIEEDNKIILPSNIKDGDFIRIAGEDIAKDTLFLAKGEKVNSYTIASLASQGVTHLTVVRDIKVAIFGTGDELRPHFEKIEDHQLYNSNSPMFLARSKELGCLVRFIRTSADTIEALEKSIKSTMDADIIITSGGVSVGDKDFTKEAFINLGMEIHFDKVDIKPGKPTVFGTIGKTAIVNLPGNPLASMVNYEMFIRTIIRKMSGDKKCYHSIVETVMRDEVNIKGGKNAVILGEFDGRSFMPLKPQMPGMVSPMQKADAMILVSPNIKSLKKDKKVKMIPIKWELTSEKREELFTI